MKYTKHTLDPEQAEAVKRMVNEPTKAALNASQYGTGKTVVSVEVARGIGASVCLVVAPLFTKYSWEATIRGQLDLHEPDDVRFINSTKSGQVALADMVSGVAGWYIIGREFLASKRIRETVAPKSGLIDIFIYDECARWANYKSGGFRMMKSMKPKYRMALSATPAANKFSGLYAITQWLWPKLEGHASYWKFVADHCLTEYDPFAGIIVGGEKDPGKFVDSLPCYVNLQKDFGDPIEDKIYVELSPFERKLYNTLQRELIVWLDENPLVIKFPITKRMRLRQMTLGQVAIDPETDTVHFPKDMKSSKYDALLGYIQENPDEPMLILTDSAKYAESVAYKLIVDGHKALHWTGDVPEDIRHAMKASFETDGGLDYIVATQASIGEGVDGLQKRARTMVWLSRSDNNMLNEQAFRRLYRRGQERQVISIDIVARDTYDEGVLSKLVEQKLAMNKSLRGKK